MKLSIHGIRSASLRRSASLAGLIVLICTFTAQAGTIPMWNTGVDDFGVVLALGSPDPHWSLEYLSPVLGTPFVPDPRPAEWIPATAVSDWLAPTANQIWQDPYAGGGPPGNYYYVQSFDASGHDLSSLVLEGLWTSDNGAELIINGASTGLYTKKNAYKQWFDFSVSSSNAVFNPGLNYFVVRVHNQDLGTNNSWAGPNGENPTGLRVEFNEARTNTPPGVPAITTVGVVLLSLLMMASSAVVLRRRQEA